MKEETKCHIINSLLTLLVQSVQESICLRYLTHKPRSLVARYERKPWTNTFTYGPRTRLIRLRLHYSKSFRIHTKNVLGFAGRLHRKMYLDYLHVRLNANSAILSKNGRKHHKFHWKTSEKFLSILCLLQPLIKNNYPTTSYFC